MRAGLVKGEGFAVDASVMPANANWREGVAPDEIDWSDPKYSSRAVREYLAALDAGELPEVAPKKVSLTDPLARWTAATGPAFYAYSTNYLADMACGVIVDVEATHAHRISEVESTKVMVDSVKVGRDTIMLRCTRSRREAKYSAIRSSTDMNQYLHVCFMFF